MEQGRQAVTLNWMSQQVSNEVRWCQCQCQLIAVDFMEVSDFPLGVPPVIIIS
jgi:hypothetical protein